MLFYGNCSSLNSLLDVYKRQILVCPSKVADAKMKMYNLDGSEGKMCGNGIRCVGKFLYDHGMVEMCIRDRYYRQHSISVQNTYHCR